MWIEYVQKLVFVSGRGGTGGGVEAVKEVWWRCGGGVPHVLLYCGGAGVINVPRSGRREVCARWLTFTRRGARGGTVVVDAGDVRLG